MGNREPLAIEEPIPPVVELDDLVHIGKAFSYMRSRSNRIATSQYPNRAVAPFLYRFIENTRANRLAEALSVEYSDRQTRDELLPIRAAAIIDAALGPKSE